MDINYEYYKIFYYVAKTASISAAAKELCVSQPAVSQAVKSLEQAIGINLFIRTKKGVSLTGAGELLYKHVAEGYEAISMGEQQLARLMHLETGEIRIGASDMTLQFYLLPHLERFHQLYPGIKVHVTNAPTPSTIDHLFANNIDFGIVTTPLPQNPNMEIRNAREIEDIYQDLQKLPIICLENDTSTRAYVDRFLAHEGVTLTPEFELATSDMIAQFAKRNLGIGSIVADFAGDYIDRGEIFRLSFKNPIPKRNMCIISDRRRGMSIAAMKLMELL
jgi:DNA-binding transcriptional LysR family regulator